MKAFWQFLWDLSVKHILPRAFRPRNYKKFRLKHPMRYKSCFFTNVAYPGAQGVLENETHVMRITLKVSKKNANSKKYKN